MIIKTIASSSAGNCYFLDDGKTRLLLDAGVSFTTIQMGLDYRTGEISGCLVSHRHGDHAKAVPQLIRRGVKVFGPQDLAELCHGVRFIPELETTGVGTFDIIAFKLIHDVPCYGYQVRSLVTNEKLVYITDSDGCPVQFQGVTHLLVEANHDTNVVVKRIRAGEIPETLGTRIIKTHMSIKQVENLLDDMDKKRLQEVRLIHLSDDHSDAVAFVKRIKARVGDLVKVTAEG